MTEAIIKNAQQLINTYQAMLLSTIDFIEEKGLGEEYGHWLASKNQKQTEVTNP